MPRAPHRGASLRRAAPAALLLLALGGCGAAEVSPSRAAIATDAPRALPPPLATAADDNDVTFACGDGLRLTAVFRPSRSEVEIRLPNAAPIVLPQQPSGSGIRYADARHELRGKGRDATWTDGQVSVSCRAQG